VAAKDGEDNHPNYSSIFSFFQKKKSEKVLQLIASSIVG
jgi:hypothetical protein